MAAKQTHRRNFNDPGELIWGQTRRCDYVRPTDAIETDWAKSRKHFEAVGQALYHSPVLDKQPGMIVLVKDRAARMRFVYRAQGVCANNGIRLSGICGRGIVAHPVAGTPPVW